MFNAQLPSSSYSNSHSTSRSFLAPSSTSTLAPPPPPSSFSKSHGVRSQLKKIPSAFFAKSNNAASTTKVSQPIDERPETKKGDHHRPLLASISPKRFVRDKENTRTAETAKAKVGKTRKGLADIFGWAHHNSSAPASKPSKPISNPTSFIHTSTAVSVAPPLPPKEDKMPQVLKKKASRALSGKPSQAGLSNSSALRVPQATPQTRARPSMGEDPFSRGGHGAEVVDSVPRSTMGSSIRSSARSDRSDPTSDKRTSLGSSKAMSMKTVVEDDVVPASRPITPSQPTFTVKSSSPSTVQNRHISAPMPLNHLPLRSASLGRVLEQPSHATLRQVLKDDHQRMSSPPRLAIPSLDVPREKALKKEETKSKVWGIFGKKKVIEEKDTKAFTASPPPRRAFEDVSKKVHAPSNQTLSSRLDNNSEHRVPFSSVTSGTNRQSRPRPPVLHIQQPSADLTAARSATSGHLRPLPAASATTMHTQITTRTGPFDSVVGSAPDRPSVEGPRTDIFAALSHKGVPKRKSLTGVFGLAIKRSMDRIRPQASKASLKDGEQASTLRAPPSCFNGDSLRSLAEEMETAECGQSRVIAPSAPYRSRFGDAFLSQPSEPEAKKSQGDLRRVASATDKLSALVSIDFSPAPGTPSDNESLAAPPSLASMDASPTPIRRVRSAVLIKKKSTSSPLKANATISPLKLALHRSQMSGKGKKTPPSTIGARATPKTVLTERPENGSEPTSMVRKGMRNIFAPPTPPRPTAVRAMYLGPSAVTRAAGEKTPKSRRRSKQRDSFSKDYDVPEDLKAIMGNIDMSLDDSNAFSLPASPVKASLALPLAPPIDRRSPRRNNVFAPPKHSLPPVPDVSAESGRFSPVPPQLTLDLVDDYNGRNSILSDGLSLGEESEVNGNRNSFDFTGEYAALDTGYQRASFVEALASAQVTLPFAPISRLPEVSEESMSSSGRVSEMLREAELSGEFDICDDDEVDDELELEIATVVVQRTPRLSQVPSARTPRKSPFQGQTAFQAHIAQLKPSPLKNTLPPPIELPEEPAERPIKAFNFISQPAAINPVPNTRQGRRRAQRMDEAGFSIASMSSVGSLIETRMAEELTNYFEVHFANHLEQQARTGESHFRNDSTDSTFSQPSQDELRHGGRDHRRNSSILSVESISEDLANMMREMSHGPPVSMHNARRSGYISRHRRSGSTESFSFGRSDWASHRRNNSVESTTSNSSLIRLGRPGIGDRMFQLDGGVQLTSITGSPADDNEPGAVSPEPTPMPTRTAPTHQREKSYDSFFEQELSRQTYDSLFDSSGNVTGPDSLFDSTVSRTRDSIFDESTRVDADSVFGSGNKVISEKDKRFLLKGVRPDSVVSTSSTLDVACSPKGMSMYDMSPVPKGPMRSYEASGEDDTSTHSIGANMSGRQGLNGSISRPAKPRRRPGNLIYQQGAFPLQPDTPALSSPSTSDTSSRLSLDTRYSTDGTSIFSSSSLSGHRRQKSSLQVKCQETIRKEPSMATLRGARPPPPVRTAVIKAWDESLDGDMEDTPDTVRYWNQWKREADDEYRRMKAYRDDLSSAKGDTEDNQVLTTADLVDFLAKSAAAYKPLDQLPIGRQIPHRRKSSLSDSRQLLSPYALPLPRLPVYTAGTEKVTVKPKKMSLETKFERTQKTSTGPQSGISDSDPSSSNACSPVRPSSAVFARFTTSIPESPPPTLANIPFSPFAIPFEAFKRSNSDSPAIISRGSTAPERQRVNSSDRRAALGWGRRRNSDGPTRVEKMAREYEANAEVMAGLPSDLREVVASKVMAAENQGKRSSPPTMGQKTTDRQALRPISTISSKTTSQLPSQSVFSTSKDNTSNSTAPQKKAGENTTLPRAPLSVRSSVNHPTPSSGHVIRQTKAKLVEGRSTGPSMQIFEDQPKVSKVARPKTSSRRTVPATRPLRQGMTSLRA